ncbi:MAG: HNH endonuclease signature motif containing protein, partial [Spirochaetaceae bacterium]|nr:HNH endonuclease signature motif containing protein [Spirochaetaceae bacterium]
PGCESRRCDAHHVEHWADGGATRLQNLVLACRFHHRALHEGGFRVVPGNADGQFRFLRPDGAPLPAEPPLPSWAGAPLAPTDARLAAAGISIGPHTATPDWYGESLDLTAALDVLWEPPAAAARESS